MPRQSRIRGFFSIDYPHTGWGSFPHVSPHSHGGGAHKKWYHVTMHEAAVLACFGLGDAAWVVFGARSWDLTFKSGSAFLPSSLAQISYTAAALAATIPFTAYVLHKYFKSSYKEAFIFCMIAAAAEVYTILPWNGMAYLNTAFYQWLGYDPTAATFLASLFIGPGSVAGPLSTMIIAALAMMADENYKFDAIAYGIGVSPLSYLSGNVWMLVNTALANVGKKSDIGLVAQALTVALAVLAANYLTFVCTNATTHGIKKSLHKITRYPHGLFAAHPGQDVIIQRGPTGANAFIVGPATGQQMHDDVAARQTAEIPHRRHKK